MKKFNLKRELDRLGLTYSDAERILGFSDTNIFRWANEGIPKCRESLMVPFIIKKFKRLKPKKKRAPGRPKSVDK